MKKINLRKLIGSIFGIMLFSLCIVYLTYAYYSWRSGNTTVSLNVEDASTECLLGSKVNVTNIGPVFDYKTDGTKFSFIVNNGKNDVVEVPVSLNIKSISDNLKVSSFKYVLLKGSTVITEGNFSNFKVGNNSITTLNVESGVFDYQFIVYIDGNLYNSPDMQDGELVSNIKLGNCEAKEDPLIDVIKKEAILDTSIDFSQISSDTNGKGVYIRKGTENDTNPIYYYRGEVTNNNVIFAGFCFKMVRTTETGGIKLIYNGVPTDGKCNNTGDASQLSVTSAFNSSYTSPAYVGYMYGTVYSYDTVTLNASHIYGNDVEYKDGQYTLKNTQTGYSLGLSNYHYTCGSASSTCTSVKYIYYVSETTGYYITLNNGKKVEDALSEMLDYNTTSSTIKGNKDTDGTIDNWYYNNIESKGYSSYLEDTIWCNDRSIYQKGGWEPNGGSTSDWLYFKPRRRGISEYKPNLACERPIDRFTVNSTNGNGSLDYPVGLLTSDEVMLAGGRSVITNETYYLYTGNSWWLGSPYYFNDFSGSRTGGFFVKLSGDLYISDVTSSLGTRPAISLKPGTKFGNGDGTYANPYIVNIPSKNNKLSDAAPGSYVKYVGNNGCSGKACEGQNANYVSDTDMGYCAKPSYKFTVNGWRVAYIADDTAYLVSAGAPECLCTNSDGTTSNSSCSSSESTIGVPKHLANLNNVALKYCNSTYAYGGVCNSSSAWNMDAADFEKITGKSLSSSSCFRTSNDTSCGYGNDLIDNGGYYWFATPYSASSNNAFSWDPLSRIVGYYDSTGANGGRPVIRLKSSVVITGGDGTYVDPYIISPTIDKGTAE